jgi:phosphoadenosine phosphosulfate reductase
MRFTATARKQILWKGKLQMAKIILGGQVADDTWTVIRLSTEESAASVELPDADAIFPLPLWQARKQEIISSYKRIGLWIDSNEAVESIADDLHYFAVIGVNFPKFADGRGFSTARLLRERYKYEGEIRAIGDVLHDQLFYMKRCGFDAFAVRSDKDIEQALQALATFPESYQSAVDQPQPLFRRREQPTKLVDVSEELQTSVLQKANTATMLLAQIGRDFSPAVFASSLGAEDMVLTDLIIRSHLPIKIFSLDTGRLPGETYDLMGEVEKHYKVKLNIYYPRHEAVEEYVRTEGINAFYDSVELRKRCCHIRKVEPLKRALAGNKAWITGLRAQQAATRNGLPVREFDADNQLEKFNPLSDWTEREVWTYLRLFGVPYNALHDKHYPSIGCAPCTRAIAAGEDVRAGRWWWESPESKECGLHIKKAGK